MALRALDSDFVVGHGTSPSFRIVRGNGDGLEQRQALDFQQLHGFIHANVDLCNVDAGVFALQFDVLLWRQLSIALFHFGAQIGLPFVPQSAFGPERNRADRHAWQAAESGYNCYIKHLFLSAAG
jgi:hypothetical protein